MNMLEYPGIIQRATTGQKQKYQEWLHDIPFIRYMFDNFFKHIDIDPNNAHILDGNAVDLVKECQDYEQKIEEAGGIELFVG